MGARDWSNDDTEIGHEFRNPPSSSVSNVSRSRPTEHQGDDRSQGSHASVDPAEEHNDCNSVASLDCEKDGVRSNNKVKSKIRKARGLSIDGGKSAFNQQQQPQRYNGGHVQQQQQQQEHGQQAGHNHEHYNQPHGGGPSMPPSYPRGQYPSYPGAPQPPGYFAPHPHAHHPPHPHSVAHPQQQQQHPGITHANSFPAGPPMPSHAYSHPLHPPPQQWPPQANGSSLYLPPSSAAPPYAHPNPYPQPQHLHPPHHPQSHPPPHMGQHYRQHYLHQPPNPMPHPHYTAAQAAAAVDSRHHHTSPTTDSLNPVTALGSIDVTLDPNPNPPIEQTENPSSVSPHPHHSDDSDDKSVSSHDLHHSYRSTTDLSQSKRNHIHRCPSNQTPIDRSTSITQCTSLLSTCTSMTSTTSSYSTTKTKPRKRKYQPRRSNTQDEDDSEGEQDQHSKRQDRRQRKNTQSRARAAKLKERIKTIQTKPQSECTEEELATLALYEERRQRKNGRSRERAMERKEQMERIMSKPEEQWTEEDKGFVGETMMAKFRKNEGDRLRRKKIKGMNGDGSASESASSSANMTNSTRSTTKPARNSTNFAKMIPISIKTSPSSLKPKKENDDNHKPISTLTIGDRPSSTTSLLGSNNLFQKFDEMVPQSSSTKEDEPNDPYDDHPMSHSNHHPHNILQHNHNAPPLTPVQANTGSSPLDIAMSPPGGNDPSQFFPSSPREFSHVIQSSPQRRKANGETNHDSNDNSNDREIEINLEHATPNSTGSILGSMLTPCNTGTNTPLISTANTDGSTNSVNILKTAHDYNWAAPIMVPTSMSSLSCLTPSEHQPHKRSMPQLTSPIRTSPLNLPRRDRSLLLSSSPRLRKSTTRSGSPILRVTRKPFDELGDPTDGGRTANRSDVGYAEEKNGISRVEKHGLGLGVEMGYREGGHRHHRQLHTPHLGMRMPGEGQSHHAAESITVSFSADTG